MSEKKVCQNKGCFTGRAKTENLGTVTDFVNSLMEGCDYSGRFQMQIDIAVEEIYTNICSYAYSDGAGDIAIEAVAEREKMQLTFIDSGCAYNPLKCEAPDITLSAQQRQIGGLGIYMVRQIMDEVSYSRVNGKNVLCMVKYADTAGAHEDSLQVLTEIGDVYGYETVGWTPV